MPETVTQEVKQTEKVPIDTLPLKEYQAARKEGVTEIDKPVETQPEKTEETEKKGKGGGFQKRIERLVKQAAALEEENRQLKEKAASNGKEPEKVADKGDPKPQKADFKDFDEYTEALARWGARDEGRQLRVKEAREAEDARLKENLENYSKQVIEAKSRYEDWKEVVEGTDLLIPEVVAMAVYEMENGADVTYFLASNPEVAQELADMTKIGAIMAVKKISIALEGTKKSDDDEDDDEETEKEKEAEKEKEKPAKIASRAAPPIKPVGAGATKSTVPLDKMDFAAYKQARSNGKAK